MANIQFCPVCGYALKRSERQCGRCGEELIGPSNRSADAAEKAPGTRWGWDYTIEAISFGGVSSSGYGIRDISDSKTTDSGKVSDYEDPSESRKTIEELRRQVAETNARINAMRSEVARQAADAARNAGEARPEERESRRNVRRLRRRTDPEFRALVDRHLRRIRELQPAVVESSHTPILKHMDFISEKVMSPGLTEECVVELGGE